MDPVKVSDVDMAFGGAGKMDVLLPAWSEIPAEIKREQDTWSPVVSRWFYEGLSGKFIPKEGIDPDAALRHIRAIIGSYEPKHEHKIAGIAYLMGQWFERFEPATPSPK